MYAPASMLGDPCARGLNASLEACYNNITHFTDVTQQKTARMVNLTPTYPMILLHDRRVCYKTIMMNRTPKFHKHNPIISGREPPIRSYPISMHMILYGPYLRNTYTIERIRHMYATQVTDLPNNLTAKGCRLADDCQLSSPIKKDNDTPTSKMVCSNLRNGKISGLGNPSPLNA